MAIALYPHIVIFLSGVLFFNRSIPECLNKDCLHIFAESLFNDFWQLKHALKTASCVKIRILHRSQS